MRREFACLCAVALLGVALAAFSQNSTTFRTRLSPVPIDTTMQSRVAGSGSVTATLQGSRLSVSGQFEGLRSPATVAHIHRAAPGMQGPPVLELNVTKAADGAVSGSLNLNPAQVEDLRNGRLYVQIHSEGAPEGNLRGWLMQ